jgi:hypothetical protein
MEDIYIFKKYNSIPKPLLTELLKTSNDNTVDQKIIKCLFIELEKNFFSYINTFNRSVNYTCFKNRYIKNIEGLFFTSIHTINSANSYISRMSNVINETNRITKMKDIFFIWFLEDFNGEIIIANNIVINPKSGQFLLYPNSWIFSLKINNYNSNDCKVIYGYIYRDFGYEN